MMASWFQALCQQKVNVPSLPSRLLEPQRDHIELERKCTRDSKLLLIEVECGVCVTLLHESTD